MHRRTEFIRLHKAKTNTSVVLPIDQIAYISTGDDDEKNATVVLKDTRVKPFAVNETPDKIYKMLPHSDEVK